MKLLEDIDDLLAYLEDIAHGEEGKRITEMRHRIQTKLSSSHKHSIMQGPLLWKPYPSVKPIEYGDYFVFRAGKIHKETWNTSSWAYNEKTISHWLEISGPTVANEGQGKAGD